jgi:acyl dehydratase
MPASFELKVGASLPTISKKVVQDNVNLYAKASGDFNPIHIDADYARQTPLGGTVAHGMLILAYLSQMMTNAFGRDWLSGGKLNVRFRAPARPGDVITVSGSVRQVEKSNGYQMIDCEVLCRNQNDEPVITGGASVKVGSNEAGG